MVGCDGAHTTRWAQMVDNQLVVGRSPKTFRNHLEVLAFRQRDSNSRRGANRDPCSGTPQRVRHCQHNRPNVPKPLESQLHIIRNGVALVACTLDENRICSANSVSDRGSGHIQAHVRHWNSGF